MPVAIPLIGAAAGIGGALLSSGATKSAANQAAQTQSEANQAAIAEQQRQFDQTRSDLSPWMTAGQKALGGQSDLMGINGNDAQSGAITSLKASPLYRSLFGNGEQAILQNASATGGLRGGNTQLSLANFGRDTLSTVIENQLNRLGGISTQGEDAAAKVGALGSTEAGNISNLLNQTGTSSANAENVAGQANAGAINSIAGSITGLANNTSVQQWAGKLF